MSMENGETGLFQVDSFPRIHKDSRESLQLMANCVILANATILRERKLLPDSYFHEYPVYGDYVGYMVNAETAEGEKLDKKLSACRKSIEEKSLHKLAIVVEETLHTTPIETFIWTFTYDSSSLAASAEIGYGSQKSTFTVNYKNMRDTCQQFCKLFKSLQEILASLNPLPRGMVPSMKVAYRGDPDFVAGFQPVDEFVSLEQVNVAAVAFPHNGMQLSYASQFRKDTEDPLYDPVYYGNESDLHIEAPRRDTMVFNDIDDYPMNDDFGDHVIPSNEDVDASMNCNPNDVTNSDERRILQSEFVAASEQEPITPEMALVQARRVISKKLEKKGGRRSSETKKRSSVIPDQTPQDSPKIEPPMKKRASRRLQLPNDSEDEEEPRDAETVEMEKEPEQSNVVRQTSRARRSSSKPNPVQKEKRTRRLMSEEDAEDVGVSPRGDADAEIEMDREPEPAVGAKESSHAKKAASERQPSQEKKSDRRVQSADSDEDDKRPKEVENAERDIDAEPMDVVKKRSRSKQATSRPKSAQDKKRTRRLMSDDDEEDDDPSPKKDAEGETVEMDLEPKLSDAAKERTSARKAAAKSEPTQKKKRAARRLQPPKDSDDEEKPREDAEAETAEMDPEPEPINVAEESSQSKKPTTKPKPAQEKKNTRRSTRLAVESVDPDEEMLISKSKDMQIADKDDKKTKEASQPSTKFGRVKSLSSLLCSPASVPVEAHESVDISEKNAGPGAEKEEQGEETKERKSGKHSNVHEKVAEQEPEEHRSRNFGRVPSLLNLLEEQPAPDQMARDPSPVAPRRFGCTRNFMPERPRNDVSEQPAPVQALSNQPPVSRELSPVAPRRFGCTRNFMPERPRNEVLEQAAPIQAPPNQPPVSREPSPVASPKHYGRVSNLLALVDQPAEKEQDTPEDGAPGDAPEDAKPKRFGNLKESVEEKPKTYGHSLSVRKI